MGICHSNESKENENNGVIKNNLNFINGFVDKNIFKYIYNENKSGLGYFCLIPFPDKNNLLQAMILNDIIIEKNDIIEGKKLDLDFDNNNNHIHIVLHADVKLYSNKIFNFTIVESLINSVDYYLEVDDDLMKDNFDEIYIHKNINLLYYSYGNYCSHKICKIEKINNDGTIAYVPSTYGCKIGIIINNSTNKLIGIIKDNEGFLIKYAIDELNGNFNNIDHKFKRKVYFNNSRGFKQNDINEEEEIVKRSLSQNPKNINFLKKPSLRRSLKNNIPNIKRLKFSVSNTNSESMSSSSCLKPLLISLYQILYVKKYLHNQTYSNILKTGNYKISNLVCEFFSNYSVKDFEQSEKTVSELENKIDDLDEDILVKKNFEQLIEFILINMHSELNKKKIINSNNLKAEDYDENITLNLFTKNYQEQNDSEIEKTFFGFKETIDNYTCCKLKKYSFELFKLITFNINENINGTNLNLQKYISEIETKEEKNIKLCSMCNKYSEVLTQQKLAKCPKILIIIINNINKKQFKFNTIIKTEKCEYNLICCISESKNENSFNIIYNLNNTWNEIKNGNIEKEIGNEIGSSILNPCVLFFEKKSKIMINDNDQNTNKKSKISNFSHIYSDINSNNSKSLSHSNILNNNTNYNKLKNSNVNLQKIKRNSTKNSYIINLNNQNLLKRTNSYTIMRTKSNAYGNAGNNILNGNIMTNPYSNIGINNNQYIYNNGMINNNLIYLNKNLYNNGNNYMNYGNNSNNNIHYNAPRINNINNTNISPIIRNNDINNSQLKNNILSHTMVINNNKFMNNNNYYYNIGNNLNMINNNINYNNSLLSNNFNHQITMINPNSNIII